MIINFNSFLILEKSNTENFIEKAKKVHDDKYDYSLVDYKSAIEKVKIICPKPGHGTFEQSPNKHLGGRGCPICGVSRESNTTEDFIKKAKKVHGNKYDYSLVNYDKAIKKVKIICHSHGIFEQSPNQHLSGRGCPICAGNLKSNTEDFIKKAKKVHDDKYDYSLVDYKGAVEKVKIICPKSGHGIFEQEPSNHLDGQGCPICGSERSILLRTSRTSYFIEKAKKVHGNKYDYSLVDYKNAIKKVKIICTIPWHGIFEQTPTNHLDGQGCPICQESKGERKVKNILIDYNIEYETQRKFDECRATKKLPFDFYLPDYNICVEYDGLQHFEPVKRFGGDEKYIKQKELDIIKTNFCLNNKIPLIRIKYTVKDIEEYLMSKIKTIIDGGYDYEKGFSSE